MSIHQKDEEKASRAEEMSPQDIGRSTEERLADLSPDDFPEVEESFAETVQPNPSNPSATELNPDDFSQPS